MDDDGTVYASLGSGGVVRVRPDGQRSTLVPWWPAGQVGVAGALCRAPEGGGLLVADEARGQILLVSLEGDRQVLADLSLLAVPPRPVGLAADADRVLVVDGSMPRVLVLDRGGTTVAQWVVPTPDKGLTPQLRGITMTPQHVFVSDAANCRIVRLDPKTGAVTRAWGDRGAFPGLFENPSGLAWDGLGLLVTDTLNHRVVRFDADGTMLDQWGMHAVRPREGRGKIHYPVTATLSPDGTHVVVAEPFERRVQTFTANASADSSAPRTTPLPANQGIASHFSREIALDGRTLLVYEPESASALVFDMRSEPPIHITTLGGPGKSPGLFGQVTTQLVDEKANRLYLVDPERDVIVVYALKRDGTAPHFDPFMGQVVAEVPLAPIAALASQRTGGPQETWPIDMRRTPSGGFALLDQIGARVIELDSNLQPVNAWSVPKGHGKLVAPVQLAVAPQGEVVVADAADRTLKRFALSDGAPRGTVPLPEAKRLAGIAMVQDANGTRYAVSDAGGDAVFVVDPSNGAVVARAMGRGDKPGEYWEPSAVEYQPADGRIYVVDYGNHRIQSLRPDGTWESSFGLGRPFVRPRTPDAGTGPVTPAGVAPSAEGAANTLAQFPKTEQGSTGWSSTTSLDGRYRVEWRTMPSTIPLRDPFQMEVRVLDSRTGQPSEAVLAVDAAMPQHGHGMNVVPTVDRVGPGAWKVGHMLFHMPGYWEIYFDIRDAGRLERAQTQVTME